MIFVDKNILWLWLNETVKLHRLKQFELFKELGSIEKIYGAAESELEKFGFLHPSERKALSDKNTAHASERYEKLKKLGARLITIDDDRYPTVLKEITDPPCVLYARGKDIDLNKRLCIAIVGARKADKYGNECAFNLAKSLASQGVIIVSGMAMGVDASSHEGALAAKGLTVAVFGCGVEKAYPTMNTGLMARIIQNGLVISEYPMGSGPERFHFPERNRIISGVSQGIIVTEAGTVSGSLITARTAYEQGRDVFAVPGDVNRVLSKGTNGLLKDGARVASCAEDVLSYYRLDYADRLDYEEEPQEQETEEEVPCNDMEKKILRILSDTPVHFDDICARTGLDTGSANAALLLMEVSGKVKKAPGRFYTKK